MAAIARSDLYDGLVRRLGYSVGLEHLLPRVTDLLERFLLYRTIDASTWRDLVQGQWGRKISAEGDIADVYAQLDILRRHNRSLSPLPGLETLAVLCSGPNPLTNRPVDDAAIVRFVLLLKVVEADGDIFLNALAAKFDPSGLELKLRSMIQHKRRALAPLFPQAASIKRLMDAISIRHQAESEPLSRLTYAQKSRILLNPAHPGKDLIPWTDQQAPLSSDYLEKACVTRSGWAEDFMLYDRRSGVTSVAGDNLQNRLGELGLRIPGDRGPFFAFWPYPFQLQRLNLSPADITAPDITPWHVASNISQIVSRQGKEPVPYSRELGREELLDLIQKAYQRFLQISPRGVLRHELPLFIAEPVLSWWIVEAGRPPPDLREFLRQELRRPDRALDFITIRGTEGGLRLMMGENSRVSRG